MNTAQLKRAAPPAPDVPEGDGWIMRRPGDARPALPRSQTVETQKANGLIRRETAGLVDWRILRISSTVIRYRVVPNEVRPT